LSCATRHVEAQLQEEKKHLENVNIRLGTCLLAWKLPSEQ